LSGAGEAISTWFGAFVVERDRVVRSYLAPKDPVALKERILARREGKLTPEDQQLLTENLGTALRTRDRRLATAGITFDPTLRSEIPAPDPYFSSALERALVLETSEQALREGWDPSVHVQEAVKALEDLDRLLNLVGERLVSWEGGDRPGLEDDAAEIAGALAEAADGEPAPDLPQPDPDLLAARREFALLYRSGVATRGMFEKALETSVPRRAPNLSGLLGAELAARMIAQAGGLDRLARLPASTIQVLGAEKAFFEHLRGHAPPPRHGLLFVHPKIQSAPRPQRGKLARALAGKVAIAARLDASGAPLDASLLATFERRAHDIRAQAPRRKTPRRPRSST
jgi:nucleolar protein 56